MTADNRKYSDREQAWLAAWRAIVTNRHPERAEEFADQCLAEFDKRFPPAATVDAVEGRKTIDELIKESEAIAARTAQAYASRREGK